MNAFLLYVLQSAICLSLFYGLYGLLLRREAFFRFNRSVLLTIMVLSMTIPLVRVPVSEPALLQIPVMQLEEVFMHAELTPTTIPNTETPVLQKSVIPVRTAFNIIPLAYLAGFFVSLIIALVSFISVARVIVTARQVMFRQQRILVSPLKINSFNFAGWIVLSEMDFERFAEEIVAHETIHQRRGHFWDLCFVNAIAVIHWFNPLVQLMRREMKALHEYEADRCTLSQGINATQYKLLLIEKATGTSRYSVACGFAQSKIKKRMNMMNKQNPNPWARWKALLFIPLAALLVQCFARPEVKRELEQISTLKSIEILQENIDWTEEKFLEELRKSLPEGVSHELNYEETWKEIMKTSQFQNQGGQLLRSEVIILAMNKNGAMLAENEHITISDVPDFLEKNLTANKDGKSKLMIIQRDINTPSDDFQKLLNFVGEAYMQKRDEIARQRYQIGYENLDADKKSLVDDNVPILVLAGDRRVFPSLFQGPPPPPNRKEEGKVAETNSSKMQVQGARWKDVEVVVNEFEKIKNRQITYNGKAIKIGDLNSDLPEQFLMNKVAYNGTLVKWILENPCIVNEKWETSANIDLNDIVSINTYTGDEAVKRYGEKAKDGIIAVTTKTNSLPTEKEWEKAAENNNQQKNALSNTEDIVVPNVFKPNLEREPSDLISNSENKNYLFFPTGVTGARKYEFGIFNRAGVKVFGTTDPDRGWNGYFEGRLCEGVFFYVIEGEFETGQSFKKIGDVTLLKTTSDSTKMLTEEEIASFEKIENLQITYNGQSVQVKDLYELIKKDTNNKIGIARLIMNIISDDAVKKAYKSYNVDIWGDRIDPENPEYYYNLNGNWVLEIKSVKIDKIQTIDTYSPTDAVKKYGDKAKNGAIAITTK